MAYFERRKKLTVNQLAIDSNTTWAKVNWRIVTGEIPPPDQPGFRGKLHKQYKPEVYAICLDYMQKLRERDELLRQMVFQMTQSVNEVLPPSSQSPS